MANVRRIRRLIRERMSGAEVRYGRELSCDVCAGWLRVSGPDEDAVEATAQRFRARHEHPAGGAPPLQPDPGLIVRSWLGIGAS